MTSDLPARLREALVDRRLHLRRRSPTCSGPEAHAALSPQRDHAGPPAYDGRRVAAGDARPAVPAAAPGAAGRRRAGAARPGRPAGRGGDPRAAAWARCGPARLPAVRRGRRRDLWVVSDLTPGLDGGPQRVGADHVLGISAASTSLAQLTIREPVGRGARPRHRLRRAGAAPGRARGPRGRHRRQPAGAADRPVQRRAQRGRTPIEVRDGLLLRAGGAGALRPDRHQPAVRDLARRPASALVYRDSGLPGDRVVEHIVRAAPDHLADGGWCQVLANWAIDARPALGRAAAAWLTPRLRRARGPARGRRPGGVRRAVAEGLRPPRRARTTSHRYDTWLAVVRGAGHRGRSASAGSTCASTGEPRAPRTGCSTGPTTSSSRSPRRSRSGRRPPASTSASDTRLVRARRPAPGDRRPGRRRAPGDDRAPPAARLAPGPDQADTVVAAPGRRLRRRAHRRADPRRARRPARPRRRRVPDAPTFRWSGSSSRRASCFRPRPPSRRRPSAPRAC